MIRGDRISLAASSEVQSPELIKLMENELRSASLDSHDESAWRIRLSRKSGDLHEGLLESSKHRSSTADNEITEKQNIYSKGNIGIAASYLSVGFGLYFIMTPIQFYMVDTLDATAGQQSVVIGLLSLPWALKVFFGFITDSLPIYGLRRKPYFIIGWLIYAFSNIMLAILVEPSLPFLALFIFLQTCGFVQADVRIHFELLAVYKLFVRLLSYYVFYSTIPFRFAQMQYW